VKERGDLDLTECFIDGSFVIAKKGAAGWEKPSGAKVQSSWQWQMALVFAKHLAISVGSASPHEVRLGEDTLKQRFTKEKPRRLIGDRAYDSDPLDERLSKQGIELIAAHKTNRRKPATQDGRPLRRYTRRWKIERLFAWLQNFRRIEVRHDRILENYLAFVLLGCMIILLRSRF
jgi:transposase